MAYQKKGEDIALQECLVKTYESLSAYKLTALAAQGLTHVAVLRKPRVAIVSIGSHLTPFGRTFKSKCPLQFQCYQPRCSSYGFRG